MIYRQGVDSYGSLDQTSVVEFAQAPFLVKSLYPSMTVGLTGCVRLNGVAPGGCSWGLPELKLEDGSLIARYA